MKEYSTLDDTNEILEPGLYFVSVPLGNARDITLRAIDILKYADILCAEDTRSLQRLMTIHNIKRKRRRIISYNDHNGARQRPYIMSQLKAGRTLAYAPEAGTPMIADPGFVLGREAEALGYNIHYIPGPSAVITALCASGFGTDRLYFAGFAPPRDAARIRYLEEIKTINASIVIYENPRRVAKLVNDIIKIFGHKHQIALCRELTKTFETVLRANAEYIYEKIKESPLKGECSVVIERSQTQTKITQNILKEELTEAMLNESLPNATKLIAKRHNIARTHLYKMALNIKKTDDTQT